MTVPLPTELEQYVDEKIAAGAFASRDAFVVEAVRMYREFEFRHELLRTDIRAAIEEAERGMTAPLDIEAIRQELAEEIDEEGRPTCASRKPRSPGPVASSAERMNH